MAYLYNNPQELLPGNKILTPTGLDTALRSMSKQLRVVSVLHTDRLGYMIVVEDKSDG